ALARMWAGRLGGERARLLAGLAYLTSTMYVFRAGGGDVEMGLAVFLGAALYSLWRLREGGGAAWRVAAGVAPGILLGIKYASARSEERRVGKECRSGGGRCEVKEKKMVSAVSIIW